MRICIDLRKDANANVAFEIYCISIRSYRIPFGVNMLSLIPNNGSLEPKVFKPETDAGILSGSSGRCSDQKNEI